MNEYFISPCIRTLLINHLLFFLFTNKYSTLKLNFNLQNSSLQMQIHIGFLAVSLPRKTIT